MKFKKSVIDRWAVGDLERKIRQRRTDILKELGPDIEEGDWPRWKYEAISPDTSFCRQGGDKGE